VIPKIIVGTSSIGSVFPTTRAERDRECMDLDALFEIGCTAFDTAASYQVGGTERLLGHWMATRRNRDRIYLITKGAHPFPIVAPRRLNAAALMNDLHASLKRLRTEIIDLYLIHRDDRSAPLEPIVDALCEAQRAGKIRTWGVSNFRCDRIETIDRIARSKNTALTANSPNFSLVEWVHPPFDGCVSLSGDANRVERELHERTQLPVLAWAPLGHGFLASRSSSRAERVYASELNFERLRRAKTVAQRYDMTTPQIALAWLFHQAFPVHAIVAASSATKMKQNLAATTIPLTEEEVRFLTAS
jgi:aryl-alcohol dehydrogenase-like predicted oxidoreductase